MPILLKRIYESPSPHDGVRILVERLWPRGLSKADAAVDRWVKDLAPSHALRKWFGHDATKWEEFNERYYEELAGQSALMEEIAALSTSETITFVFASREERFNNAAALKAYIEALNAI